MGRRKDYIPLKDTVFFGFQKQLVNKVVANKAAWGIPDAAVTALVNRQSEYEPLHRKSQEKRTRTMTDVMKHRHMRKTYEKEIRIFVKEHLMFNSLITDGERVGMALTVRDTEPSPRGRIEETPMVGLRSIGGGFIQVTCKRETDQNRPSMHRLADAIECRYMFGPVRGKPPDSHALATMVYISKKARFIIECGDENAGLRFYGFFRWVNLATPSNSGQWSYAISEVVT